jgi:hypothetical protein
VIVNRIFVAYELVPSQTETDATLSVGNDGGAVMVIVTVAGTDTPPLPSLAVYVNVSDPDAPTFAVYRN